MGVPFKSAPAPCYTSIQAVVHGSSQDRHQYHNGYYYTDNSRYMFCLHFYFLAYMITLSVYMC